MFPEYRGEVAAFDEAGLLRCFLDFPYIGVRYDFVSGGHPFHDSYCLDGKVDKVFVDFLLAVASGKKTRIEESEYQEIAIFKSGVTLYDKTLQQS